MKVAYVVRDLRGRGGIQNFAITTSEGLGSADTVKVINWRSPLSLFQEATVRFLPNFITAILYRAWFKQSLNLVLDNESYDIVHFWHIKSAMAVVDTIDIPYILTCHGSEVMRSIVPDYQFRKFMSALEQSAFITTPSKFTKDYLINHYSINSDKIVVINPGVDIDKFSVRKKRSHNTQTIGTLTRLVKRKNIGNIIKALTLLQRQGVNFKFVLVGDGRPVIKSRILFQLKRSTFQWSYLSEISEKEKTSNFYPGLDAFVLPPLQREGDVEGFGIVFLEANASGVPVVAANTGGISDAVKPGISGIFANPNSPTDIAEKILRILESENDYIKSAHLWARNFSQEKTASKFSKLYVKALRDGAGNL